MKLSRVMHFIPVVKAHLYLIKHNIASIKFVCPFYSKCWIERLVGKLLSPLTVKWCSDVPFFLVDVSSIQIGISLKIAEYPLKSTLQGIGSRMKHTFCLGYSSVFD